MSDDETFWLWLLSLRPSLRFWSIIEMLLAVWGGAAVGLFLAMNLSTWWLLIVIPTSILVLFHSYYLWQKALKED